MITTAKIGDRVIGRDKVGNVVAGEVLGINTEKKTVQVSPSVQSPIWCPMDRCVTLDVAFASDTPKSAELPASETAPAAPPATT